MDTATHPWEMYCDVVVTTVQHSTAQYGTVQRPLYAISGLGTGWEEAEAAPPVAPHNPHIWAVGAVTPSLHRQYNQLGIGGQETSITTQLTANILYPCIYLLVCHQKSLF